MPPANPVAAAILVELIPELKYAAPVLLERYDRGEPLIQPTTHGDLGFEGGAVDSVLLEFFKALVPYVKAALGCGILGVFQAWQSSRRDSRHHAALITMLSVLVDEETKVRQAVERMADTVAHADRTPISRGEVVEWIASALYKVDAAGDTSPR